MVGSLKKKKGTDVSLALSGEKRCDLVIHRNLLKLQVHKLFRRGQLNKSCLFSFAE
ncbi:unnamed protein product, partial [Pylaiella littoralis]